MNRLSYIPQELSNSLSNNRNIYNNNNNEAIVGNQRKNKRNIVKLYAHKVNYVSNIKNYIQTFKITKMMDQLQNMILKKIPNFIIKILKYITFYNQFKTFFINQFGSTMTIQEKIAREFIKMEVKLYIYAFHFSFSFDDFPFAYLFLTKFCIPPFSFRCWFGLFSFFFFSFFFSSVFYCVL